MQEIICGKCGSNKTIKNIDRYGMIESIECENCGFTQVNQPFNVWRRK